MRAMNLLLTLLACSGTPPQPEPAEITGPPPALVTLVYTARLDGELEPCG